MMKRIFLPLFILLFCFGLAPADKTRYNRCDKEGERLNKAFMERFDGILEELDALAESRPGEVAEDMEDLNAELEDALMLLGELKDGDIEELTGALEDIRALADDYRALAADAPDLADCAGRLAMAAEMALSNAG